MLMSCKWNMQNVNSPGLRIRMAELAFEIRAVWLVFPGDRTLLKERHLPLPGGFVSLLRDVVVFCIVLVCILSLSRVLSSEGRVRCRVIGLIKLVSGSSFTFSDIKLYFSFSHITWALMRSRI